MVHLGTKMSVSNNFAGFLVQCKNLCFLCINLQFVFSLIKGKHKPGNNSNECNISISGILWFLK